MQAFSAPKTSTSSPRKEIIAIKKLNYSSPRVNISYPNGQLVTSTIQHQTGSASSSAGKTAGSKKPACPQQQMTNFHQTSIDLEYLTRKLKQFQLAPSPSSPTLGTSSASGKRGSSRKQHDGVKGSSPFKKHNYHLNRSVSNAEHIQNPYLIEFASKSEPNTERNGKAKAATVMRTSVVVESEGKVKDKMNRSQSQLSYRREQAAARFEVSRVYASKLAYEKADEFPCFSEAPTVARRHHHSHRTPPRSSIPNSSGVAANIGKYASIKKSKSSHIIKSAYSPKSFEKLEMAKSTNEFSDSNRTTPSTSQSNFNNEPHPQTSSRSSKHSHVRSSSPTSTTHESSSDEGEEECVGDENEIDEDEDENEEQETSSSSPQRSQSRSASIEDDNDRNKSRSQRNMSAAPLMFNKSGTAAAASSMQAPSSATNYLSTAVPASASLSLASPKPIGEFGLEAAAAARIKFRRASVNNLVNSYQNSAHQQSQRSIVIRREKSASVQASSKNEDDSLRQQQHSHQSDTSASHNHRENYSSTTTSGIESFKNSLNIGVEQPPGNQPQQQQPQPQSESSYVQKINELKNRLFVMEIELDNEKKKLAMEKEMKTKLLGELKTRYETEKTAALKALEAKLNAEKLYELNKLKEAFEADKRDEIDTTQKSYESEMMSLKLKLRDKNDKCIQLEKLLKEEYHKNSKFYLKSMEVVRKYNQELKMLNNEENSSTASLKNGKTKLVSVETQTIKVLAESVDRSTVTDFPETDSPGPSAAEFNQFAAKLVNIKFILDDVGDQTAKMDSSINVDILIAHITAQVRDLKMDSNAKSNEIKTLKSQNNKLASDLKQIKESKLKLESLYKIKCKSDLNKSAQIKKLEIGYQIELIKFRNEFNSDLVRYLETKLLRKESLVNENFNLLTGVLKMISQLSAINDKDDADSSGADQQSILMVNLKSRLESLKDPIKSLLNSNLFSQSEAFTNNQNSGGSNPDANNASGYNSECKKIPLNLIVKNSNPNDSNKHLVPTRNDDKIEHIGAGLGLERSNKIPIQKFSSTDDFNRTKKLHDDMVKLDRKLKNIEKHKPVLLPGGCSFRDDTKKPNLTSMLGSNHMGKPMNNSISVMAINENLNSFSIRNQMNEPLTEKSRKMSVQIIQAHHGHQSETSRSDNLNKKQIDTNLLSCR